LSDKFIEEKKDLQNALNWVLGKFLKKNKFD
jgi:hypothetical protein